MAGQFTQYQKTYKIMDSDGVSMYTGVTYGDSDGECVKPQVDNSIPLGVVTNDERVSDAPSAGGDQTGKSVAVQLGGIASILMDEDVSVGERVYLGIGGTGKVVPDPGASTPVNFNVLGFAEKGGSAGDVIPVRMSYHVISV